MKPHMNYILARQRVTDLQRAAAHGRPAGQARAARRNSRTKKEQSVPRAKESR